MALKHASLQWAEDGALRSADYGDVYFQRGQGAEESRYVFLERNELPARFAAAREGGGFRIAELGFGTGLNFLLTADLWRRSGAKGELFYASVEKHPLRAEDLARALSSWPELDAAGLLAQYPPPLEGFYHLRLPGNVRLMLCLGDAAEMLQKIDGTFDAWYLDGFAPAKNPGMWDEALLHRMAALTAPGGTFATFSAAGAVRRSLTAAGFTVEKVQGYGVKRDMTVGRMQGVPGRAAARPVTVLGAGLAGASAAFALAEKGCAVTVIDRQPGPAMETSGNPVGVLYPKLTAARSPMGDFYQHGFFFTRNLVMALGLPSWNPCGVVDAEEGDRPAKMAESGWWPEEFMRFEGGALHFPLGGFLSPRELCRRLLDHPRIETRFSTEAEIPDEGDVVVALAMQSGAFADLPLVPVRGQMSFLKATAASAGLGEVLSFTKTVPPAVGGIHYVGATFSREPVAEPALRVEDDAENLAEVARFLPQFGFTAGDIVGARAGYRTTLPDHLPVIGRMGRVFVTTGFGGHGLSGAPLAGEILASQIMGTPLPLPRDILPFLAPERFSIRAAKRGKS